MSMALKSLKDMSAFPILKSRDDFLSDFLLHDLTIYGRINTRYSLMQAFKFHHILS